MRPRYSIGGPLILIAIGVLFLAHTISPDFQILTLFARYWPYFLILWGVIQLFEVAVWALRPANFTRPAFTGGAYPYAAGPYRSGISGGGWFLVLLICFIGFTTFEVNRPGAWWRQVGFDRSVQLLGNEHEFSVAPLTQPADASARVVLENFRGDARVVGVDAASVSVGGHKLVRALDSGTASHVNAQTPVQIVLEGKTIVIRCNQEGAGNRTSVTTNLELSIPKGASFEATGIYGDFDISALKGNVDLSSENAGVRIQDIGGNVHIETRKSDEIRCARVKGTVSLRGHGDDVDLSSVQGEVSLNGDYTGTVAFHNLVKPVRYESSRTTFSAEQVPGEVKMARGSLDGHGLSGPVQISTRDTDVILADYTDSLSLSVDKGDIDLRPGHLPLGKTEITAHSGDIDLALPPSATYSLTADTRHGDISNDLNPALNTHSEGQSNRLEGSSGSGPSLTLTTDRGDIRIGTGNSAPGTPKTPMRPLPAHPPKAGEDSEA